MKIAEYKKISEEIVENIVMVDDFDQDGNIIGQHEETVRKVIPVMGMVYREMTPAEMVEAQSESLKPQSTEVSVEEKMELLVNSMPVTKPTGVTGSELPLKVGCRWQMVCEGNAFAWQLVEDKNAIGTAENPIVLTGDSDVDAGVPMLDNAYYVRDGIRYVYMSGQMVEF